LYSNLFIYSVFVFFSFAAMFVFSKGLCGGSFWLILAHLPLFPSFRVPWTSVEVPAFSACHRSIPEPPRGNQNVLFKIPPPPPHPQPPPPLGWCCVPCLPFFLFFPPAVITRSLHTWSLSPGFLAHYGGCGFLFFVLPVSFFSRFFPVLFILMR